jgi:hypothetical protein
MYTLHNSAQVATSMLYVTLLHSDKLNDKVACTPSVPQRHLVFQPYKTSRACLFLGLSPAKHYGPCWPLYIVHPPGITAFTFPLPSTSSHNIFNLSNEADTLDLASVVALTSHCCLCLCNPDHTGEGCTVSAPTSFFRSMVKPKQRYNPIQRTKGDVTPKGIHFFYGTLRATLVSKKTYSIVLMIGPTLFHGPTNYLPLHPSHNTSCYCNQYRSIFGKCALAFGALTLGSSFFFEKKNRNSVKGLPYKCERSKYEMLYTLNKMSKFVIFV